MVAKSNKQPKEMWKFKTEASSEERQQKSTYFYKTTIKLNIINNSVPAAAKAFLLWTTKSAEASGSKRPEIKAGNFKEFLDQSIQIKNFFQTTERKTKSDTNQELQTKTKHTLCFHVTQIFLYRQWGLGLKPVLINYNYFIFIIILNKIRFNKLQ